MPTTVFFATNRLVDGSPGLAANYSAKLASLADPATITYGVSYVDGVDIAAGSAGQITWIGNTSLGDFTDEVRGDLSEAGRNLMIFIHGFDNTFSDAITRAAFNREWMASSGTEAADTTVVAFAWPSKGQLVSFPVLQEDYLRDQTMAGQSGFHLMSFFSRLEPLLLAARRDGRRTILLAHSMGNHALEAALTSWFTQGNGQGQLFDEVALAAADCRFDTFQHPDRTMMSGLSLLAGRVSVYFSNADQVLHLSQFVNLGAQRLGQDGPRGKADPAQFPADRFRMIDCTKVNDYQVDFMTSHQYYRLSPAVRSDIAAAMSGEASPTMDLV